MQGGSNNNHQINVEIGFPAELGGFNAEKADKSDRIQNRWFYFLLFGFCSFLLPVILFAMDESSPSTSTPTGNTTAVKCDHCGKILGSVGNRDAHVKRMHTAVSCDLCHEILESNKMYRDHCNQKHWDKRPKISNITMTPSLNDLLSPVNLVQLEKAKEEIIQKTKNKELKRLKKVDHLSRKVGRYEVELSILRRSVTEKDTQLAMLQQSNQQLRIGNDVLNENLQKEQTKVNNLSQKVQLLEQSNRQFGMDNNQLKVSLLCQTIRNILRSDKNLSFPLKFFFHQHSLNAE